MPEKPGHPGADELERLRAQLRDTRQRMNAALGESRRVQAELHALIEWLGIRLPRCPPQCPPASDPVSNASSVAPAPGLVRSTNPGSAAVVMNPQQRDEELNARLARLEALVVEQGRQLAALTARADASRERAERVRLAARARGPWPAPERPAPS